MTEVRSRPQLPPLAAGLLLLAASLGLSPVPLPAAPSARAAAGSAAPSNEAAPGNEATRGSNAPPVSEPAPATATAWLVKDIEPSNQPFRDPRLLHLAEQPPAAFLNGSYPRQLFELAGRLYFVADDRIHGSELWTSDGTAGGTVLVADLCPGACGSAPEILGRLDGSLLVLATDPARGRGLYRIAAGQLATAPERRSDQTPERRSDPAPERRSDQTPERRADQAPERPSAAAGAATGAGGAVQRLATLCRGAGCPSDPFDGPPRHTAVELGGSVFFTAPGRDGAEWLWRTDGSVAGTAALARVCAPGCGVDLPLMVVDGSLLYVDATGGGEGASLWRLEPDGGAGAEPGVSRMVAAICPGAGPVALSEWLTMGGQRLALLSAACGGAAAPAQLIRTDGTPRGTFPLIGGAGPAGAATPGARRVGGLTEAGGGEVIFTLERDDDAGATLSQLWRTDGTPAGTAPVPGVAARRGGISPLGLVAAGFLYAAPDAAGRPALWRLAVPGERPAAPGLVASGLLVEDCRVIDGVALFSGWDGTHGWELWRSDGTAAGTFLVQDLQPGPDGSAPAEMTAAGGLVFFAATDEVHGRELWAAGRAAVAGAPPASRPRRRQSRQPPPRPFPGPAAMPPAER